MSNNSIWPIDRTLLSSATTLGQSGSESDCNEGVLSISQISSITGFFWLYGISTTVSYLIPNPLYTYILNIYDLVWLDFMAYQPL